MKEMDQYLFTQTSVSTNGLQEFFHKTVCSLWSAVNKNDVDVAKEVLKQAGMHASTIVNIPCGALRISALQILASRGVQGVTLMKLFLDYGANANVQDKLGRSPLHHASLIGFEDGVILLLKSGATVHTKFQLVKSPNAEINVENTDSGSHEYNEILAGCQLPLPECWGRTPLHQAVKGGHPSCVKLLLKAGADPNAADEKGITPLLLAGAGLSRDNKSDVRRYEDIVSLLVSAGADVNVRNFDCDTTALHHAAMLHSARATEILLDAGISLLECKGRVTALHEAASSGCVPVVTMLIKRGGNILINQPDQVGRTPLHKAAYSGSRESLSLLINAGGDLSARTSTNVSVMDAIFSHVPRPINFLLEILDKCIIPNTASVNDRSFKVQLDFSVLTPPNQMHQMAVITALISAASEHQKKTLLQHPLLQAFLRLKWNKLRIFFFLLLAVHTIFVGSLSVYVAYQVHKRSTAYEVVISRRVLLTSVTLLLVYGLGQVAVLPRHYLRQFETLLNLLCAFLALSVTIWGEVKDNHTPLRKTNWVLHVLSVIILLAWAQLMLLIGRFPTWGYYALMFYTVLQNVIKVLLTFGCLVIGFAFSFLIQFQDELQFSTIWLSTVKTTVMMMGEYEYGQLFENPITNSTITRLPVTSRIIFLLFVILASIVLMNLMVGLAVSDIQALQLEGHIRRLLKQADFIEHLETITTNRFLRGCALQNILYRWLLLRHRIAKCITLYPSDTSLGEVKLPYKLLELIVTVAIHNQHSNSSSNTRRNTASSFEGNVIHDITTESEILHLLRSLQTEVSSIQEHLQMRPLTQSEDEFLPFRKSSIVFSQAASDIQGAQAVIRRLRRSKKQPQSNINV